MNVDTLKTTIVASGAGQQRRFITFGGTQAAAGEVVVGVPANDYTPGMAVAVDVLGVAAVEAGGAVAIGAWVVPDAQGRAISNDGTAVNRVGRALNAVTAAGQTLFILIK